CGANCVDEQNDSLNCGTCGEQCSNSRTCQMGQCACPAGNAVCNNGACTAIQSDPNNCGGCAMKCSVMNGTPFCSQGRCRADCTTDSGPPLTACNAKSGVDVPTDNNNCGSCNNQCGAGGTCKGGSCTCSTGETTCNGSCTDTQTDSNNCGSCGKTCPPSMDNCVNGACS